ncbi:MAG TPA: T9SS type A sorting domain-containing protein [Bacteroidales bacterium]|nr:T9SS type A sorting domain-containing protein [Bacteroidales bacterium]
MRIIIVSILLILFCPLMSNAQSGEKSIDPQKEIKLKENENEDTSLKIFPVPVTNSRFTITSDKAFEFVRMTNIIGQETTREKFSYPRKRAVISFSDARKGIYLVTIRYEDKTRVVKKILVDS